MAEVTLAQLGTDTFNLAETELIALIREAYPTLDLRRGTVLRDMLIRPAASVYALSATRMDDLRRRQSLQYLVAAGATTQEVDALLANFNLSMHAGAQATGIAIINVATNRTYVLSANQQFVAAGGLIFATTREYIVKVGANTQAGEIELQRSGDGTYYFFQLPLTAEVAGATPDVVAGSSMEPTSSLYGFVSGYCYSDFTGGVTPETITDLINRLPLAISYKAMESRTSIEAKLRSYLATTPYILQALGIQGYGDAAQLRDKHNPWGVAVGSRVDLYPRTFEGPVVTTLQATGTLVAPNQYLVQVGRTEAPGFYSVKAVSELVATDAGTAPTLGGYAYTASYSADGLQGTFHDIDPVQKSVEAAFSCYQTASILVTGVPYTATTRQFKLELYTVPGLQTIQDYCDDAAVRNLEADYIVRSPLMCFVEMKATVYYPAGAPIDVTDIRNQLAAYINSRSFVARLTRSELANIMLSSGVTRLDFTAGFDLKATVPRDAQNVPHSLAGDTLDLASIENPDGMLTANTCCFVADVQNIILEPVAE